MELSTEKRSAFEEQSLALLKQLVEINTHHSNPDGIAQAQEVLASALKQLGLEIELHRPGRWQHLVAKTPASGRRVLLLGHVDTVYPPDSDFRGYHAEGNIARGPGVFDMKGGLVIVLQALRLLAADGVLKQIPLTVLFNADEEITSIESARIIAEEARSARAALVFEFARTKNFIITRRKGIRIYRAKVNGKATHAGDRHEEGRSAILRLARYITDLESLTDYDRELSCNVGMISGGVAANIRPEYAQATFEVRATRITDFEELDQKVRDLAARSLVDGTSIELEEDSFRPPMEEQEGLSELLQAYIAAAEQAGLHLERQPHVDGGGSDANLSSYAGVPSLDSLGPTGGNPHSDREYTELDSILPRTMALYHYLKASG